MLEGPVAAELFCAPLCSATRPLVRPGHEADTVRGIAGRFLALLAGKPGADGPDAAVADMGLRATFAATIAAEVEALERCGQMAAASGPGVAGVKGYLDTDGDKRLIGRADSPEGCGPVYEVPLFGTASVVAGTFTVGTVTHLSEGGAPVVERAMLASPGQPVELLPGWVPLAS